MIDDSACPHHFDSSDDRLAHIRVKIYFARLLLSNGKQIQMVRWIKKGSTKTNSITFKRKNESNQTQVVIENGGSVIWTKPLTYLERLLLF